MISRSGEPVAPDMMAKPAGVVVVVQLVLAVLATAGAVYSWLAARTLVEVAPVAEGEPSTTSIAHYPPLLLLALLLATVAGVLVVLAGARWRRGRRQIESLAVYTP